MVSTSSPVGIVPGRRRSSGKALEAGKRTSDRRRVGRGALENDSRHVLDQRVTFQLFCRRPP